MPETNHVAEAHIGPEGVTVTLYDKVSDTFIAQNFIPWADVIEGNDETYAWRMFTDAVQPVIGSSVIDAEAADHPSDAIDADKYDTFGTENPSVE